MVDNDNAAVFEFQNHTKLNSRVPSQIAKQDVLYCSPKSTLFQDYLFFLHDHLPVPSVERRVH